MATTDIIDNYPGFDAGVDGIELGMKMAAGAERFGAKSAYAEITEVVVASVGQVPRTRIKTGFSIMIPRRIIKSLFSFAIILHLRLHSVIQMQQMPP